MKHLFLIIALLLPANALAKPIIVQHAYPSAAKTSFLKNCIGLHKEMINPCKCMLVGLQNNLSFEEFIALSQKKSPQQDGRFAAISNRCIQAR